MSDPHDEMKTWVDYVDEESHMRMTVDSDNPGFPGHPKITVICPDHPLSLERLNEALGRLRDSAGISAQDFPDLTLAEYRRTG